MGMKELVLLYFVCLPGVFVVDLWLFLTGPLVGLQRVIVVSPGTTHLLFLFLSYRILC